MAQKQNMQTVLDGGTEVVVYYRATDLAGEVLAVAPQGVDVVWDTSGYMDYAATAQMVAVGGKVLVTAAGEGQASVPWGQLYTKDVDVSGFVHSRASAQEMRRAAEVVNTGLADGWLQPNITETAGLDAARRVHEQLEAGEVRGRIVLRVGL